MVKGRIVRRHLFGLSFFKAGPLGSYYSSHFFDLTLLSLWGECSYWLNSTWHLLSPSNQTPYSLFLCYIPQGNMLQADFSSPADWIKSFPFKPRVDSGLHWEGSHCKVYVWQRMRGSLGNLWVRPSVPSTSEWLCVLSLIDRHMHKIYVTGMYLHSDKEALKITVLMSLVQVLGSCYKTVTLQLLLPWVCFYIFMSLHNLYVVQKRGIC